MDVRTTVNNDNEKANSSASYRKGGGYYSGDDGGAGRGGKGSISRKVANDAINNSRGGTMGASVYIADTITNTINFNF